MFNAKELKLVRQYLGDGVYMILLSLRLDDNRAMYIALNNEFLNDLMIDDTTLRSRLEVKRTRTRYLKMFDEKSDYVVYGLDKIERKAKENLLGKVKAELRKRAPKAGRPAKIKLAEETA